MAWISTSERDLKRIEVLSDVRTGRRTVAAAAVLAVSERQAYRLLARYEAGGGAELIHKARGQTSNRSVSLGIRQYAVELVKIRYADFGPTLATEVLLDKHQLRVGKETLVCIDVRTSARTLVKRRTDASRSIVIRFASSKAEPSSGSV